MRFIRAFKGQRFPPGTSKHEALCDRSEEHEKVVVSMLLKSWELVVGRELNSREDRIDMPRNTVDYGEFLTEMSRRTHRILEDRNSEE